MTDTSRDEAAQHRVAVTHETAREAAEGLLADATVTERHTTIGGTEHVFIDRVGHLRKHTDDPGWTAETWGGEVLRIAGDPLRHVESFVTEVDAVTALINRR